MAVRCGRGWVGYCNGEEVAGIGIATEGGMVIGPRTSTTTVNDANYPRMLCSSCQWGIRKRNRL